MSWLHEAACTGLDPAMFFPERGDTIGVRRALAVCAECPVRTECLDYAKRNGLRDGIYGGIGATERRTAGARTHACPHCPEMLDSGQAVGAHVRFRHPDKVRAHGTNWRYTRGGCRCEDCKAAHREWNAAWKARRKEAV